MPAGADPIADCSTTQGEIVVVDFSPWGGNIVRGCAATLSTGYAGLQSAGFTTAGDDHDGPALICRIDDDPPPSQDACVNTPPASAYWSDWHAAAGSNTWSYSTQGPMSYEPQPGSVDAWVFGGTNVAGTNGQPTFTPAQVRATNIDPVGSGATTTTAPPTAPPTTAASASPPAAVTPARRFGDLGAERVRWYRDVARRDDRSSRRHRHHDHLDDRTAHVDHRAGERRRDRSDLGHAVGTQDRRCLAGAGQAAVGRIAPPLRHRWRDRAGAGGGRRDHRLAASTAARRG